MHCMLMDLLHGFEVLSTTEETLFNSRNVSRLVLGNYLTFVVPTANEPEVGEVIRKNIIRVPSKCAFSDTRLKLLMHLRFFSYLARILQFI